MLKSRLFSARETLNIKVFRVLRALSAIGFLFLSQACRPSEGPIHAGESIVIPLSLKKGQFQTVSLQQDGDLVMTLSSPSNARLRVNYFDGAIGEEKLFLKADETGDYKLAISLANANPGAAGRYKLTVSLPRGPTQQDEDRLEAQRLFAKAAQPSELKSDDPDLARKREVISNTYEEAVSKWRTAGESTLSTITLLHLGQFWYEQGKYPIAKTYFDRAMQEAQFSGDRYGQTDAMANIASVSDRLSKTWEDKRHTQELFDRALGLSRETNNLRVEASTLNNLARYYRSIGRLQEALKNFQAAQVLMHKLGNQNEEGIIIGNIGGAYRSLGMKKEAEEYFAEALALYTALGDPNGQARSYNGFGSILDFLGEKTLEVKQKARDHFREAVRLGVASRDRDFFEQNLGAICYELGMIHHRLGELNKAGELFDEAQIHLDIAYGLRKDGGRIHHTLTSLGLLLHARGRRRQAAQYLEQALAISRSLKDDYQETVVLAAEARVARDHGRLGEARARIEEALQIVESVAARIGSPERRATFTTAQRHFYSLHADILLRLRGGRPRNKAAASLQKTAWLQMERARDAALQGSINVWDILSSMEGERSAIEELKALSDRISYDKGQRTSPESPESVSKLLARYEELEKQIALRNPRAGAIINFRADPGQLLEIQTALKPETLLLQYSLGEDCSYLWAITQRTFDVFPLPGESQLETLISQARDALNRPAKEGARTHKAVAELGRLLLGPVASQLKNKKLLIVADGMLDRVSFGALPSPSVVAEQTWPASRLLIEDHEIIYEPSARMLLLHSPSTLSSPPLVSVVAIADPVFNSRHPQAANCKTAQLSKPADLTGASLADRTAEELAPVPFGTAERTAFREAIFGLSVSSSPRELFGFQANRNNVMGDKLAPYREIAFYTHGIFNEREQGVTGLALSRLDEKCAPRTYLLTLPEIYELKLSADMVSLIACNTARSQSFGLGSISRGFMYAGSARVMGTLWDVNGQASLELVTRFYHNRRAGRPASEALRNAQLSFLKGENRDWRFPYYWAGFVLMGKIE